MVWAGHRMDKEYLPDGKQITFSDQRSKDV